ncbi:MAG: sugar ABC transporter permease [Tessaracoccus sp.]
MTTTTRGGRRSGLGRWGGALYVLPSLGILCLIALAPIVYSAYLSFTNYDVLGDPVFTGMANYERLIVDQNFWNALRNTAIFTLISVPLQMFIPMVLAEVLARYSKRAFSQVVRSVLFVPVVASMILIGTVWQFMLAPNTGFFNTVLTTLGMSEVNFLGRPWLALVCVSLVSVWKNIGYFLVLFYAGVLDIPSEQFEAARVDGATPIQQFFHITLPGLRPVVLLCTVLATIWSFQAFDLVYAMTGGGPGGATTTLVMAIYSAGFQSFQMGYASAIAMVLLVVVLLISVLQRYLLGRGDK